MFHKILLTVLLALTILPISHAQTDDEKNLPHVAGRTGYVTAYHIHDGVTDVVFDESSIANPAGPWWSSDGRYFAISTWVNHDSQQLMQFDTETGEVIPRIAVGWETPIPSPDFSHVAYENEWNEFNKLNVASIDGSGAVALELAPADATVSFLGWSSDSEWLLFSANSHLYRVRIDGTEQTQITPDSVQFTGSVAQSPDGEWLAFTGVANEETDEDIYLGRVDGTDFSRLTTNPLQEFRLAWSPDGAWIAFLGIVDEESESDIYVVRADGTEFTQLTTNPLEDSQFTWSPDSTALAFVAVGERTENSSLIRDLFTVDIDGTNLTQLTNEDYVANPHWSGEWIIFSDVASFHIGCDSYCSGVITAIHPDGTDRTPLTAEDVIIESFAVAPIATQTE